MLYDKDIREPLFDYLEEYFGKIRIFEEKQIGKSRADAVMVMKEALVGIEIKSDADTYVRLSSQVKDYNDYFDFNLIVVGSSHGNHIKDYIPQWWGIITVEECEGKVDFYFYRPMSSNMEIKREKQLSFLWRTELAHIQELNGMAKYKEKSKKFVIDKILKSIPEQTLRQQISSELFERDYHTILDQINQFRMENHRHPRRKKRFKKRISSR